MSLDTWIRRTVTRQNRTEDVIVESDSTPSTSGCSTQNPRKRSRDSELTVAASRSSTPDLSDDGSGDENVTESTKPDSNSKKRRLNESWLNDFPWLKFSEGKMFCKICMEAAQGGTSSKSKSKENKYILTCGTDGEVRVWKGIDDDDALSHRVGDRAYAIAFKNDRFFTATDTNSVQASKFPDGMPDGLVTRFTAPVNHMAFSSNGQILVAGSSDFTVKVVEVETSSHKVFRGHKAPILSVALDPIEQFVATASCDGTVQVWSLLDQSEAKTLQLLDKCSDVSLAKSLCRLCWSPCGQFLLVPVNTEIYLYARNSWEKVDTVTLADIKSAINIVCFSPDKRYIAVACVDGLMAIVDWKSHKCLEKHKHGLTITALAWDPTDVHRIVFCDREGQLGMIEDLLSSTQTQEKPATDDIIPEGVFDDDDDMLIKASGVMIENDDDDDTDSIDLGAIKKSMMPLIMGDEDSNMSNSMTGTKPVSEILPAPTPVAPFIVEGLKQTPLQKPFQPGSTPGHLSSRFMKWNDVGIIRQYNTDDENSIDIEFHDTAVHHAMHISNTSNYTSADLSLEAVILASEGDEESNSKLTCMHFGTWDSAKEWSISMPAGEVIQAVTMGKGWVAAATSSRTVRLFTIGGVQQTTFALTGPVVCLVGHQNSLLAVYHAGMGIPGDQNLGCLIVNIKGQRKIAKEQRLPLSPKATLSWAGFSAEGTPFIMDSDGIVRMLNSALGSTWVQVANTRDQVKGKSDHYWIVGVNENPQELRCILCKGSRYPATLPRPAVTVLPFQLSLCEQDTERSQYEEQFLRSFLFAQHLQRLAADGIDLDDNMLRNLQRPAQEALMKLFALSVRSDREFRAMEVCEMMPDDQTLQLSIKYATRQRHLHLAQRISQLAQQRAQEQEHSKEEEDEDFRDHLQASHNSSETEWTSLSSLRAKQEENDVGENIEEDEEMTPGPLLNVKPKEKLAKKPFLGSKSNPFKVASQEKETSGAKGTRVFDSFKRIKERAPVISPLPISIKQSKGGQGKIAVKGKEVPGTQAKIAFLGSDAVSAASKSTLLKQEQSENETDRKPASAFELWLEEHRDELQEEHPELSAEEFSRVAAEQFQALTVDERRVWLQKAKSLRQVDSSEVTEKKRKREEDEREEDVQTKVQRPSSRSPSKMPLSQSSNAKLSKFAFFSKN